MTKTFFSKNMPKSHTPEIMNMPGEKWSRREFPKWDSTRQKKGGIGSMIIGTIIWVVLVIIFLVVAFASLICGGINSILAAVLHRPVRTPWLIGFILVFFFPINVIIILIGWGIKLIKN